MASARAGLLALVGLTLLGAAPAVGDDALADRFSRLAGADLALTSVAYRLQTAAAAASACARKSRLSGLIVQNISQYRPEYRAVAARTMALHDLPVVVSIVSGSAAAKAGVLPGDAIEMVNGVPILQGLAPPDPAKRDQGRWTAILGRLLAAFEAGPVELTLRRGGETIVKRFEGVPACASYVQLSEAGRRNAAADGQTITIDEGMWTFFRSDVEMAVLIGHELAHNLLSHRDIIRRTGTREGLLAGVGANGARLRETEREADYVGLYLVAWAGYDIHAAPGYWQRIARTSGVSKLVSEGTHPSSAGRARDIAREVAEIEAKRKAGRPLVPDYPAFRAADR